LHLRILVDEIPKSINYVEGFTYSSTSGEFVRHAFNTNKGRKVYDFTLKGETKTKYDIYMGVIIPLAFVRKI
jgi:hypothetical protein